MLDHLLNNTCRVLKHKASDGSWGSNETWEADAEYRCRLQPVSSRKYVDGKVRAEATHQLFLPFTEEISARDRIEVDGYIYEIVGTPEDAAGHHDHLEIYLKRPE